MLSANEAQWSENHDQQEFSDGKGAFHGGSCPDMDEFSQLLAKVSTDVLWKVLMTQQQRTLATALWEACNYGGKPKPGDFKNMEKKRDYAEWVLRIDHRQQWNKAGKIAKL